MTKRELIKILGTVPDNTLVIISKSENGSWCSPLASVGVDMAYKATNSHAGDLYSRDEDAPAPGVPCVVLYPVG